MGQPTIPPTPAGTDLTGKTIIITGGNAGMGYEAARQFLILHASRVILAVRSPSRGQEAVSSLKNDVSVKKANPDAVIDVFQLDLDDYQSGLDFANKVKQEVKELDILLNNGGVNVMKYQQSKSGHERVMQGKSLRLLCRYTTATLTHIAQSTATRTYSLVSNCCRSSAPRLPSGEHLLI